MNQNRNSILRMDDTQLSGICKISFCKGSGPGGQKRNKTSSLAKVEFPLFGLCTSDCTERSQFRNRTNALRKMRMLVALKIRMSPATPPENMNCSMHSSAYPLFAAQLLDVLEENYFDYLVSAEKCGISPSAILKKLHRDPQLWQFFQKRRSELMLPSIHAPE